MNLDITVQRGIVQNNRLQEAACSRAYIYPSQKQYKSNILLFRKFNDYIANGFLTFEFN